jgi:hypothetical protein
MSFPLACDDRGDVFEPSPALVKQELKSEANPGTFEKRIRLFNAP